MVTPQGEHKLLSRYRIKARALQRLSQHGLKPKKAHVSVTLEVDGDNIRIREIWVWVGYPTKHKEGNYIVPLVVGQELPLGKKQLRVIKNILKAKGQL